MILGVLDFETTGIDVLQDRVWEVGQIIYSTGQQRVLESTGFLVATDRPICAQAAAKLKVNPAAVLLMCKKFGYDEQDSIEGILEWLKKVDAVIGQNINQFDWEVLRNWANRYRAILPPMLLIDTMWDLPGVQGHQLQHMAADDGFLNLAPHCALADCQTTLKLIENRLSILDKIVERAKSPVVILQSLQDRDNNEQAKDRNALWNQIGGSFHWNDQPGHIWWKAVKEMDVEAIAKAAPFDVAIRRDLNLRELRG
jgi:DNA polymerase III epsilon subunit-like protein